ncbi:hypothetical protein AVEN_87721-1 [Araneus ventricosus]|uniref:Uncharacterized protein n=1 Tax=Araneus ventricosus TaxID=182803 RepID=A0A4Y2NXM4_ARAVE|nr:hypothetical protein AVEN_87721-1 [Araneus ventricosus]
MEKPRKRSSGSGAGKKFPPSGTHRTVSTEPSHCFPDTCWFSDGEKCLSPIQMSSRRSGQKFLPPTPKVPLGNASGRNGGTLAGAAVNILTLFFYLLPCFFLIACLFLRCVKFIVNRVKERAE